MPWLSKAQARWGNSPAGLKALGGEEKVSEWNRATTKPLPERKGKTKEQKSLAKLKRGMLGQSR